MPTVDYERINWEDYPSQETPINAANLNKMDAGIAGLYRDYQNILGSFATVESSPTASVSYKAGDYLIMNECLYRVTSAISQGGLITPSTNVVQTTVGEEIKNRTLWWQSQAISAVDGTILTIIDPRITEDHVMDKFVPNDPSCITSDITCTTSEGQAIFTGTCTAATSAEIKLVKKDN